MKIISHRGYWLQAPEKNTEAAFRRSFGLGFGTETDLRDRLGELVISHDPATSESMTFSRFLAIYSEYESAPLLALNVKADGLQEMIISALSQRRIENYFLFDMSVPDHMRSKKFRLPCFTRASEVENNNLMLDYSDGVWYDGFERMELDLDLIDRCLGVKKSICFVSPELHGRDRSIEWAKLKIALGERLSHPQVVLCTDFPEAAEEFFNGP